LGRFDSETEWLEVEEGEGERNFEIPSTGNATEVVFGRLGIHELDFGFSGTGRPSCIT
jgi:hypothetical protein